MKAAAKYCGGCNPRYDRRMAVLQLETQLKIALLPAVIEEEYDVFYVVCGCSARCVDVSHFVAKEIIVIDDPKQILSFIKK